MIGDLEGSLAEACADLARTMARSDAATAVLPDVAEHVAAVLGVRTAGLVVGGRDGRVVVVPEDGSLVPALWAIEQELGEGPTVDAFGRGDTALVHTLVDVGDAWPRWVPEARALGVGAWLSVPSATDEVTAVVSAYSTRPRRWQEAEAAAARVLADLAAGWAAHAHELDQVRRTAAQLQDALDHRLVIEQAKGILAGELGCSLDQAFALLRQHARSNNAAVRSVAHAVVELGLRPTAPRPTATRSTGRPAAPRSPGELTQK
jgi:hypothetical protein